MVQDQSSNKPGRWTKTGKVMEHLGFESYLVKLDGSNLLTKRNRRFLRKILPFIDAADPQTQSQTNSRPPTPPASLPPAPPPLTQPLPAQQSPAAQPPHPQGQPSSDCHREHEHENEKKPKLPPHLRERWIVNKNLAKKVEKTPAESTASQTNI